MSELLNARDVDFLLYEWLGTQSLLQRPRHREHSREVFDAVLESAREKTRLSMLDLQDTASSIERCR